MCQKTRRREGRSGQAARAGAWRGEGRMGRAGIPETDDGPTAKAGAEQGLTARWKEREGKNKDPALGHRASLAQGKGRRVPPARRGERPHGKGGHP